MTSIPGPPGDFQLRRRLGRRPPRRRRRVRRQPRAALPLRAPPRHLQIHDRRADPGPQRRPRRLPRRHHQGPPRPAAASRSPSSPSAGAARRPELRHRGRLPGALPDGRRRHADGRRHPPGARPPGGPQGPVPGPRRRLLPALGLPHHRRLAARRADRGLPPGRSPPSHRRKGEEGRLLRGRRREGRHGRCWPGSPCASRSTCAGCASSICSSGCRAAPRRSPTRASAIRCRCRRWTGGRCEHQPGGVWRVTGASVPGVSHLRSGLPCQDAHAWRQEAGGVLIAAVADGAGSAPARKTAPAPPSKRPWNRRPPSGALPGRVSRTNGKCSSGGRSPWPASRSSRPPANSAGRWRTWPRRSSWPSRPRTRRQPAKSAMGRSSPVSARG